MVDRANGVDAGPRSQVICTIPLTCNLVQQVDDGPVCCDVALRQQETSGPLAYRSIHFRRRARICRLSSGADVSKTTMTTIASGLEHTGRYMWRQLPDGGSQRGAWQQRGSPASVPRRAVFGLRWEGRSNRGSRPGGSWAAPRYNTAARAGCRVRGRRAGREVVAAALLARIEQTGPNCHGCGCTGCPRTIAA